LRTGQGERVERQEVLGVFGFAVVLDHPAIHDDPGYLDREGSGVQAEQVPADACQLAAPHARGSFEDPQREEPIRPGRCRKA
jgi:hypothetical protein